MKDILPSLRGNRPLKAVLSGVLLSDPPSLSHAYIIEGSSASVRQSFAGELAMAVCCENRRDPVRPLPCGVCRSCRNIAAGIAPDVTVTSPDEGRSSLGIDKIRDLRNDIHIYPTEFDYKIYIVDDADSMTVQAQNAFLLTLEEPPAYAMILLLCEDGRSLLETVRSRAPMLRLEPETEDGTDNEITELRNSAAEFAALCADRSNGARAMSLLISSCKGSREIAAEMLSLLRPTFRDLAALKRAPACEMLFFTDREAAVKLSSKYTVKRLLDILDAVGNAAEAIEKNMNTRLTLMKMLTDAEII